MLKKETFEILNEYKNKKLKILMHCFTGSQKFAEKLLNLILIFLQVELLLLKIL